MIESGRYRERIRSALFADLMKLKTKLTSFSTVLNIKFDVHNMKQMPPIEAIKELINSCNYFVIIIL